MNNKQRKEWDNAVEYAASHGYPDFFTKEIVIAANAYILKLERELQNIKTGKRIAKILMPKETT